MKKNKTENKSGEKKEKIKKKRPRIYGSILKNSEIPEKRIKINEKMIKKTLKYEKTDILHIKITYPAIEKAGNSKFRKRFEGFYSATASAFMKYCEKQLYPNAAAIFMESAEPGAGEAGKIFRAFGGVLTYEITYNAGNLICVLVEATVYAGSGRGRMSRRAHLWDFERGIVCPAHKALNLRREERRKAAEYICGIMEAQTKNAEERYYPTDGGKLYRLMRRENFYLAEKGAGCFFLQDTIAPAEYGIKDFIIPRKSGLLLL